MSPSPTSPSFDLELAKYLFNLDHVLRDTERPKEAEGRTPRPWPSSGNSSPITRTDPSSVRSWPIEDFPKRVADRATKVKKHWNPRRFWFPKQLGAT